MSFARHAGVTVSAKPFDETAWKPIVASIQCPVCYDPLEVRDVTPCFICGGWPASVERFDPHTEYRSWRLPNERSFVLCRRCELEEFMVPGGWGSRLDFDSGRPPLDRLRPIPGSPPTAIEKDKFCPHCNLRLAFLNIIAEQAKGS